MGEDFSPQKLLGKAAHAKGASRSRVNKSSVKNTNTSDKYQRFHTLPEQEVYTTREQQCKYLNPVQPQR